MTALDGRIRLIYRPKPYRVVNTVHIGYRSQAVSVVEAKDRGSF